MNTTKDQCTITEQFVTARLPLILSKKLIGFARITEVVLVTPGGAVAPFAPY